MLLAALGSVRIGKNCDLGLENAALGLRPRAAFSRPRSQFFPIRTSQPANNIYVRLELARLVSSLLYGNRAVLVLNVPAFEIKTCTAYDRFHGNGPFGEIPTKKEPIKTLGFPSRPPCHIINGLE